MKGRLCHVFNMVFPPFQLVQKTISGSSYSGGIEVVTASAPPPPPHAQIARHAPQASSTLHSHAQWHASAHSSRAAAQLPAGEALHQQTHSSASNGHLEHSTGFASPRHRDFGFCDLRGGFRRTNMPRVHDCGLEEFRDRDVQHPTAAAAAAATHCTCFTPRLASQNTTTPPARERNQSTQNSCNSGHPV